jgi:MoxR-like ATPase
MTSNAEREFPPPFLRRCIRLTIKPPDDVERLKEIVDSHLSHHLREAEVAKVRDLIATFIDTSKTSELATDQLLNAVFLTIGMADGRTREFTHKEIEALRTMLLEKLS